MKTHRLALCFFALALQIQAQIVVTSLVTATTHEEFSSTQHYDYLVGSEYGGVQAPSFVADLGDATEFIYKVTAPAGQRFVIDLPGTGQVSAAYIGFETYWTGAGSGSPAVNVADVSFVFHDYTGPGLGSASLPMKMKSDGSAIQMVGSQQLERGTHSFSGFSLVTSYTNFDTSGWGELTYNPLPFRVYYFTLGFEGVEAGNRITMAAVPEPWAAAAISGVTALALALWRRSRRAP